MDQRKTDEDRLALPDVKSPDQPWFIPNDDEQSVYRFIIAASKRARQLQAGARPLISTTSRKPTKIGMEEIRQGIVAVELNPAEEPEPEKEIVALEEPII